jgi:hypothetical protein
MIYHKYPSIVALNKQPEIFSADEVVATEKIHGANFRVFIPAYTTSADEIRFGSRNQVFDKDNEGFYGGRPIKWFKDQPELLQQLTGICAVCNVIIFGEAYGAGIQKGF